ncbi:MAG: triose-phosphate isomerase [Saprospiraceae bacterium]|nr:triose-phosphate isomerase [Saprospiraceae bacterium]
MRKKIAAGNWKMYKNFEEAIELATSFANSEIPEDVTVILGVPFVYLKSVAVITAANKRIFISAQNSHDKNEGAYTGEVSPVMLKSMEIPFVILGHSERREYYNESPELLKLKVRAALDNGLKVIFCVGEPLLIRKAGNHEQYVKEQLKISISELSGDDMKNIVIAYEPIWAIGTGETATPEQAQEMHKMIRSYLNETFGQFVAKETSILYGGSVKPSNAREIFGQEDVDGGLVGGASLDFDSFYEIINAF